MPSAVAISEFKRGLVDRQLGRPMMASVDDAINDDAECSDAYFCGYDPHGELNTDNPNAPAIAQLTEALACAADVFIPESAALPRNRCEFPS